MEQVVDKTREDTDEAKTVLKELTLRITQLQKCREILQADVLKGKYKESYDFLIKEINRLHLKFCMVGMIRRTANVEEYLRMLQTEFDLHQKEVSRACKYLKNPMLARTLRRVRKEILEAENAYCNQFLTADKEIKDA